MSEPARTESFAEDVLDDFGRTEEVEIETRSASGGTHAAIIWIVVEHGVPYVRSVKGVHGRWYQDLLRDPHGAVHVAGRRVPVRAELVEDPRAIAECSRGLAQKYASDPSTPSMLRPEVLETTLRLLPNRSEER